MDSAATSRIRRGVRNARMYSAKGNVPLKWCNHQNSLNRGYSLPRSVGRRIGRSCARYRADSYVRGSFVARLSIRASAGPLLSIRSCVPRLFEIVADRCDLHLSHRCVASVAFCQSSFPSPSWPLSAPSESREHSAPLQNARHLTHLSHVPSMLNGSYSH